jgi:hypothetical protein
MDKDKLYKKACEDYNSNKFSQCAKKINKIHKKYKAFDPALSCFCAYKLMENNIKDGSLEIMLELLQSNEKVLDDGQTKILNAVRNASTTNNFHVHITDPKKLQKFKVVNAYYDKSSSGIGDFLRGTCYLHNLLNKNKVNFNIDFSKHSIGNYIKSLSTCKVNDIFDTEKHNKTIAELYFQTMIENLTNILNNTPKFRLWRIKRPSISLFSNYSDFVFLNEKDKLEYEIGEDTKEFVKSNIIFSNKIEKTYNKYQLNDYVVAHFRLGDVAILKDHNIPLEDAGENVNTKEYHTDYDVCLDKVVKIIIDSKKTVVLLSDSNSLKRYIKDNIPQRYASKLRVLHLNSFHSSSNPGFLNNIVPNNKFKKDKMFYVALDLKICTNAKGIYTYSVYPWGSGFTFWISKIYNIPLTCEKIHE